jgi:uncharacterized membrane protein
MSDSRARIWFSLFVLAVFCVGGAAGFVIGRHAPPLATPPGAFGGGPDGRGPRPFFGPGAGRRGGAPGPFGRAGGGPPPLPPDLIAPLTTELQLDADQQDAVKKILAEHRAHLDEIHRDARGRFDKEQEELQNAVRGVLHPDQQDKFQRFLERRR